MQAGQFQAMRGTLGHDRVEGTERELAGHVDLPAKLADIGDPQGQGLGIADLDLTGGREGKGLV